MSIITVGRAWKATVILVLLYLEGLTGIFTSMTELENQMMDKGTFVFSTLSPERLEKLFEDFQTTYSRKVKHDTNFTDAHGE